MAALPTAGRIDRRPEPARPPKRQRELNRADQAELCEKLDAMCARWEAYEGERRARDRRGMRLFRGERASDALGTGETKLVISSPTPLALLERVWSEVLRGMPEPEVIAINPDDEDGARIAEGAIRTNWSRTRMREKIANGGRLSSFTRAIGFYHFWRHELNGGIGDVDKRRVPGHRLIVDDRVENTLDMEYIGFEETEFSRAKLITLFPDKAEEIEAAADAASDRVTGLNDDPLRAKPQGGSAGGRQVDRLVTANPTQRPPYKAVSSIRSGGTNKPDPLSDKVRVRFMWIDDRTPMRVRRPRIDPKTKRAMYVLARNEDGRPQLDDLGHDVVNTPLGPQYVPRRAPKFEVAMEDAIERKYKFWRHVAYIVDDGVVLWDVAWDGPVPISILRDRLPAYGFDAPGTALRLATLDAARAVLWTIIFELLKKSLRGTFVYHRDSGLKKQTLVNEIGAMFQVNMPVEQAIKDFPTTPLDSAYFSLLDKIEIEEELLVGITPQMKGQAAGRADSPQTYEQIADQSGGPILDRAKLVDQFTQDAAEIDLWFMQHYYTHKHVVEVEQEDGYATWRDASALTIRGRFAVRVEATSTLGSSVARDRADAEHAAQLGFYALPMLGRTARIKHWRQALKQKGAIMAKGPQFSWLLGAAAAPPAQQSMGIRARTHRTHHRPGGR